MNNWATHYEKIKSQGLPPSATLLKALSLFCAEKSSAEFALDLGCGTGIDTLELLSKGWNVIAIDKQADALHLFRQNAFSSFDDRLKLIHGAFESVDLPTVDLINASFSLPFCSPENFEDLWERITNAIKPEGRFAGHFLGLNDSWATNGEMTFLNKQQVHHLFDSFSIEWIEESEKDGKTISGKGKHWHVFHVVAKKSEIIK